MKVIIYDLEFGNDRTDYKLGTIKEFEWNDDLSLNIREYLKHPYKSGRPFYNLVNQIFRIDRKAEEYGYLITIDNNGLVGLHECAHGSDVDVAWNTVRVLARLRLSNAKYFFMVHNHPAKKSDGIHAYSEGDINTTIHYINLAFTEGIPLVDHLIIGDDCYTSMRQYSSVFSETEDEIAEEFKDEYDYL